MRPHKSKRIGRQGHRKAKKSYALSPEAVEFLEALRKKRRAASTSAVLEEILLTARRGEAHKAVDRIRCGTLRLAFR
jgi:DNA-binding PadR family transcriptional regulator